MSRPDLRPRPIHGLDAMTLESRLQATVGDGVNVGVAVRRGRVPREEEFFLGREALGRVLRKLGDVSDPTRVRFPHPALSLSHSAGTAVAVGVSPAHADGLGVDVELPRTIDVRATRFFLAERERRRFPATDPAVVQLLWTAKEAVFKADLGNRGRALLDYEVVELSEEVRGARVREGVARRGRRRFRFRTCSTPDLLLSIARPERKAQ